jgi:predicted phage terminase large subunit-like protein
VLAELKRRGIFERAANSKSQLETSEDWRSWLERYFPHVCTAPFADRHVRLWEWFDSLESGVRPLPCVEVWARGGGKSSSGELGCVRVGEKLSRRFALYVCGTQDQADLHVQSIAAFFESRGIERAVGKYGSSKGWRRNQLRTADGFNVAAFGLDAAQRGIKIEQYRPDLILFDDIDSREDTPATIEKKIRAITSSVLPTGSSDCAVLFLQNKIHEDSIVSQLCDGRADFLHDREPARVEPAVNSLQVRVEIRPDGAGVYRIVQGTETWMGQSLAVCERQINDWGLKAFLREAQHEVEDSEGVFFRVSMLQTIAPADLPQLELVCLAWDLAATEGGGDYTAGVLMGKDSAGRLYVLAVLRGQWSSERVREVIQKACALYLPRYRKVRLRLPQDPGQAGKAQKSQVETLLADWRPIVKPVTGAKATRAEGFQDALNKGNVCLVTEDISASFKPFCDDLSWQKWHRDYIAELKKFREDDSHDHDDQVDASADNANELLGRQRELKVW